MKSSQVAPVAFDDDEDLMVIAEIELEKTKHILSPTKTLKPAISRE